MAAKVLFASAHLDRLAREASLPHKYAEMVKKANFGKYFADKTVAIKMHFGGGSGIYTLHPFFVRTVVQAIKEVGGRPFCTDGTGAFFGAAERGYTQEVLGCPILPAGGVADKYYYPQAVNYETLDHVELCGNIVDADAMLVLSHGKGHGHSGFGGAIKNIAMGCVSTHTRGAIHGLMAGVFEWDEEKCTHCYQCRDNCPTDTISFDKAGNFRFMEHHCRYCMHCVSACPVEAIKIDMSRYRHFQMGMAWATKKCLEQFSKDSVYYITVLNNITPLCDCWGWSTQPLVPDVGAVASADVVAVEQAALDLIAQAPYIEGTLPDQMKMGKKGHLFQRVHAKDPYLQVECCAELKLGRRDYNLVQVGS
jgi:uncharacterized Fe-S center protein